MLDHCTLLWNAKKIELSSQKQYTTTIVTKFGNFRYNGILMGICASGDIFQAKADDLLADIKVFKTYMDDIMVLSKESFPKIYNR